MKRAIFAIILFIAAVFANSQDWTRDQNLENSFRLYGIEIECWYSTQLRTIVFEDVFSRSFEEAQYRIGYTMTVFEFILSDRRTAFQNTSVNSICYSYFVIQDRNRDRYSTSQLRYDFIMPRDWLTRFYSSAKRERDFMLSEMFNEHYRRWFPPQSPLQRR